MRRAGAIESPPPSNLDLVRELVRAFNRGERAVDALPCHPGVVLENRVPESILAGTHVGLESVGRYLAEWGDPFATGLVVEILEEFERGDLVTTGMRIATRGRASGLELDWRPWHVYTVQKGLVVRLEIHADREAALVAGGVIAPDRRHLRAVRSAGS